MSTNGAGSKGSKYQPKEVFGKASTLFDRRSWSDNDDPKDVRWLQIYELICINYELDGRNFDLEKRNPVAARLLKDIDVAFEKYLHDSEAYLQSGKILLLVEKLADLYKKVRTKEIEEDKFNQEMAEVFRFDWIKRAGIQLNKLVPPKKYSEKVKGQLPPKELAVSNIAKALGLSEKTIRERMKKRFEKESRIFRDTAYGSYSDFENLQFAVIKWNKYLVIPAFRNLKKKLSLKIE